MNTPEQRSSVASAGDVKHPMTDKVMKRGMAMKVKNNTDAPWLRKINWKHSFLVVLHLLVCFLSALSHEFVTTEVADRALPQGLL